MIVHFNRPYVHTGEFDREIYRLLMEPIALEKNAIIVISFLASTEESAVQLEHAEAFVKTVEAYILRKEEEKRRQEPKERLRQNRKQSLNSGKEERMF